MAGLWSKRKEKKYTHWPALPTFWCKLFVINKNEGKKKNYWLRTYDEEYIGRVFNVHIYMSASCSVYDASAKNQKRRINRHWNDTCEHWTVKSIVESVSSNGHRPYERNMISLISPMGDFVRNHIVLDAIIQYISLKIQFNRIGFSLTTSTQHCADWWILIVFGCCRKITNENIEIEINLTAIKSIEIYITLCGRR